MNMAGKTDFKYNELINYLFSAMNKTKSFHLPSHVNSDKRNSWGPATIQVLTYALAYVWQLS